jgi:GT2 family glycosyltransferase
VNPVLILTHDNLELTKRCVESIQNQDIPTSLFIFDNGSTDKTSEYVSSLGCAGMLHPENVGVSAGWNTGLDFIFEDGVADHVLVTGNDTVLSSSYYRHLIGYGRSFVSGTETKDLHQLGDEWDGRLIENAPDFGSFLIRRVCWRALGYFDESMRSWASDCDFHIRAHRVGIPLLRANLPYYHERSSTIRLAPPKERRIMELQADADRETFRLKWGCLPGTPEYGEFFK